MGHDRNVRQNASSRGPSEPNLSENCELNPTHRSRVDGERVALARSNQSELPEPKSESSSDSNPLIEGARE